MLSVYDSGLSYVYVTGTSWMTIEFHKNDTKRKHNLSRFKTISYFLSVTIGGTNSRTESTESSTANTCTGRTCLSGRIFMTRVSHRIVWFYTKRFWLNIPYVALNVNVSFLRVRLTLIERKNASKRVFTRRKHQRGNRTKTNVWILYESVAFFSKLFPYRN